MAFFGSNGGTKRLYEPPELKFITDRTAPIKLGQTKKQSTPLERANQN